MPIDREGTLRKAEKLLRQGKLDLAIAEYRAVIEDQPSDWNTANTLGDLYVRAKQIDKAAAEYNRIAEHLGTEGFYSKAVALYKKILKIKPDDENTLLQLGTISARQGLLVDARSYFKTLAERRKARGDARGAAEARVRLGDLDGADVETRLAGARARVELGDAKTAVDRLKQAANDLREKGKDADALRLLTGAAEISPDDPELRRVLMQASMARQDFEAACQFAAGAADLQAIAAELFALGRDDEGLKVLASAADAAPDDLALRVELVNRYLARGDVDRARPLLTPEVAGSDPNLLWVLAEMELRAGRVAEGTALLQQILTGDPSRRDALVILGCSVAEVNPDAGYECIEVAARAAIASDEWGSAAAALNEFVNRVPHHVPALMRLVEICVDGGLEATMYSAQAQLADAYLATGAASEARVIAEDLVAREPWERANIERFRRALAMLGETDIDGIIADRLSGQSPFTSTDFLWASDPASTEIAPMPIAAPPAAAPPATAPAPAPPAAVVPGPAEDRPAADMSSPPPASAVPGASAQDAFAIDLNNILAGESQPAVQPAPVSANPEIQEVDLSSELHDLRGQGGGVAPGQPAKPIESVLKGFRDEAVHDASPETAEQHFKLASTYMEMGMQDEAMKALAVAARSPRHRFRAGAMLGKAYLNAGDPANAIEWFSRAVEAPAPSPQAHHALLYDLALLLESNRESARALAVFLELQAEAGEYRDVSSRLEQLKVQMGS